MRSFLVFVEFALSAPLRARAAMHLPSAWRWRLIAMASSSVVPSAPLLPTRSHPARSTKSSFPLSTLTRLSGLFWLFWLSIWLFLAIGVVWRSIDESPPTLRRTVMDRSACDLLDAAFSRWFAHALFRSPSRSTLYTKHSPSVTLLPAQRLKINKLSPHRVRHAGHLHRLGASRENLAGADVLPGVLMGVVGR